MSKTGLSYGEIAWDIVIYTGDWVTKLPGNIIRRMTSDVTTTPTALSPSTVTDTSMISIIVPTYNEQGTLGPVLESIYSEKDEGVEVIIADGGSTDDTLDIAKRFGARVLNAPSGRSNCLNAGAEQARGSIVMFLHADTVLPRGYAGDVRQCMKDSTVSCGAFRFELQPRLPGIWLIEGGTNLRVKLFQTPYGDQALFWRKDVFDALGGFPQQLFMEDYDLVLRSRAAGKVALLDSKVITSSRRWKMNGVFGNTFTNQLVIFGRGIGVPLPRLAQWYYGLMAKKQY